MYQVKYSLKNIENVNLQLQYNSNVNGYLIDQLLFTMQNTTLHKDIHV